MADDKTKPNDDAPVTLPKKAPSKPAAQSPLEKAVGAFVNGFHVKDIERDLVRELKAVGITSLDDLQGHRLKAIRRALDQTLRASAHRLLGAAEPFRKEKKR